MKQQSPFLELAKIQVLILFYQEFIGNPEWTLINLIMSIAFLVCIAVEEWAKKKSPFQ